MKRILCSDWLPERAKWAQLSPLGIACFDPAQENIPWSELTKLVILGQCRRFSSKKLQKTVKTKRT